MPAGASMYDSINILLSPEMINYQLYNVNFILSDIVSLPYLIDEAWRHWNINA